MFKTAPKIEIHNPERNAYTAFARTNKRVKIVLDDPGAEE